MRQPFYMKAYLPNGRFHALKVSVSLCIFEAVVTFCLSYPSVALLLSRQG